ncbi:carbohydrate-responsive element-binding protein-like [Dromaius novaehollandiae]|uniref:carbohydrate-responsive element-binding protein-like n=1 Tax=Dromaius novaehollandiae TaxID=8790 RepID=UPI0031204F8B
MGASSGPATVRGTAAAWAILRGPEPGRAEGAPGRGEERNRGAREPETCRRPQAGRCRGHRAQRMLQGDPAMSQPQIIHSGHFMVSEPHAEPEAEAGAALKQQEEAGGAAGRPGRRQRGAGAGSQGRGRGRGEGWVRAVAGPSEAYNLSTVDEATCQTYHYGPHSALSIDASLTKLFECMTLAYSGRIMSPKWKTFKGLKLLQRDKIRLNNAIWRAWYLQYVERRKNPACNSVMPLEAGDGEEHCKPEAGVMEGKYWKRHVQAVTREYHKWEMYSCAQVQKMKDEMAASPCQGVPNAQQGPVPSGEAEGSCPMELDPLHNLEMLIADLADTIFYSRNPYGGPNPCSLAHQDNADMIQPTLGQLHPNFGEDFMDILDPLSGRLAIPALGSASPSHQLFTRFSSVTSSGSLKHLPAVPMLAARKGFFTAARPLPVPLVPAVPPAPSVAPTPLGSPSPPGSLGSLKEEPTGGPEVLPLAFPLELEPPAPLEEQQTFLPLFPTSPLWVSPSPGPPALHLPPQLALVLSVVAAEDPAPTTGTFAVLVPAPLPVGAPRRRPLQRIAPAPGTACPPASPAAVTPAPRFPPGTAALPIAPARNPRQGCSTPDPPAGILLAEKSSHPHSSTSPSGTDVKAVEGMGHASRQACSLPGTKVKLSEGLLALPGQWGTLLMWPPPSPCCLQPGHWAVLPTGNHARRMHISSSFSVLASLVAPASTQSTVKLSKAHLLQRSVAYVGRLQQERQQGQAMAQRLRGEIQELSAAIREFQQQLPPGGTPAAAAAAAPQADTAAQLFADYVRRQTLQDWRFWLFSTIMKPLFESYSKAVSTSSTEDFCQSVLGWLEQHCTLPVLRPAISSSLLQLSRVTSILTQPTRLPEQALQAVSCLPHSDS